jgi:hypothetical protein
MVTGRLSPPNGHHHRPQQLSGRTQYWCHPLQAAGCCWCPLAAPADRPSHEVEAPPIRRGEATKRALRADHGRFYCPARRACIIHDGRQRVEATRRRC